MLGVVSIAALIYHFASPKVIVDNRSQASCEELLVELPVSRVSVGPLGPGDSQLIYFSPQHASGEIRYSLRAKHLPATSGSAPYPGGRELFRVVHLTIRADGSVTVSP